MYLKIIFVSSVRER